MRTDVTVDIDACPEHVWAVLTDVSRWPHWTSAVREVRLLGGATLGPGSVIRVRAAGLPDRTWWVGGYVRQSSFTWTADGLGGHARVAFRLGRLNGAETGDPVRTRLAIEHEREGWVAGVVQRATGRTTTRHLHALAEGLRVRCEQRRRLSAV